VLLVLLTHHKPLIITEDIGIVVLLVTSGKWIEEKVGER